MKMPTSNYLKEGQSYPQSVMASTHLKIAKGGIDLKSGRGIGSMAIKEPEVW